MQQERTLGVVMATAAGANEITSNRINNNLAVTRVIGLGQSDQEKDRLRHNASSSSE